MAVLLYPVKLFITALQFLTAIPFIPGMKVTRKDMGRALLFFPAVGAVVAAFLWGTAYLLISVCGLPALPAAVIVMVIEIAVTRAFHWDGLMDTFDGLFATHKSAEEMLAIMHDSRVGAMGVMAGVAVFALQTVFISVFMEGNGIFLFRLLAAFMLAKWGGVLLVCTTRPATEGSSGMVFKEFATPGLLILATVLFVVPLCVLYAPAVPMLAVTAMVIPVLGRYFTARTGGISGDMIGASIKLMETVLLFAAVVMHENPVLAGWLPW